MRCRDKVFPLAAACHNENIPIELIEYLLKHGSDENKTYKLNSGEISII